MPSYKVGIGEKHEAIMTGNELSKRIYLMAILNADKKRAIDSMSVGLSETMKESLKEKIETIEWGMELLNEGVDIDYKKIFGECDESNISD